MVFSCLVPDVWNLIFNLVTILVLLPPAPCHFICTPHNSPFWDLCTLASDLPRTAVAHTTKLYEFFFSFFGVTLDLKGRQLPCLVSPFGNVHALILCQTELASSPHSNWLFQRHQPAKAKPQQAEPEQAVVTALEGLQLRLSISKVMAYVTFVTLPGHIDSAGPLLSHRLL